MAFTSTYKKLDIGTEIIAFNADSVTTGVMSSHLGHVFSVIICNETSGVVAGQKAAISGSQITLSGLNANDVGTIVVIGY